MGVVGADAGSACKTFSGWTTFTDSVLHIFYSPKQQTFENLQARSDLLELV
jgi:hypothetical protein